MVITWLAPKREGVLINSVSMESPVGKKWSHLTQRRTSEKDTCPHNRMNLLSIFCMLTILALKEEVEL